MKKYKLIKEYPGCKFIGLNLGNIVKSFEYSGSIWYNESGDSSNLCINSGTVENYPEFWEEVKEKEWEIIKLKAISNPSSKPISDQFHEGKIRWSNDDNPIWKIPEELLKEKGHCIYQIKRLSDGETFTIGDRCTPNSTNNSAFISKFEFISTDILRIQGEKEGKRYWYLDIKTINKVKEPLFTTEDGVDIYEEQGCFGVCIKEYSEDDVYKLYSIHSDIGWHSEPNKEYWKTFSTKEKAEQYIFNNKIKTVYGVNGTFTKTASSFENKIKQDYAAGDWKWFDSEKERDEYIEENKPRFSKKDMLDFARYCWYITNEEDYHIAFYEWLKQK